MTKIRRALLVGAALTMQVQQPRAAWEPTVQIQQMANYGSNLLQATVSTTYKSAGVLAAAGRRFELYEVNAGQTGTLAPTDCQCEWDISRIASTNTLAGTTVALNLNDQADVTASTLFYNNLTTEPPNITTAGLGLNLLHFAINQRGSMRWRALDDGDRLIIASTASQGLAFRLQSSNFSASAVGSVAVVER
jgi:hypothetical protein